MWSSTIGTEVGPHDVTLRDPTCMVWRTSTAGSHAAHEVGGDSLQTALEVAGAAMTATPTRGTHGPAASEVFE